MGEKIFVVDDDVSDQEFLGVAFTEIAFHQVEFFSNVFSIVQKLKTTDANELPKLIVTDYQMPSLDGFNLVTFVKKNARLSSIKVVILTGSIAENEKHRLISAGVNKILFKPNSLAGYKTLALELRELVN